MLHGVAAQLAAFTHPGSSLESLGTSGPARVSALWAETGGMQLMRKKGPARGRGGRGGGGSAVTKLEPVPSFFKFFSPPRVPTGEVAMDEQDLEDLQETLQEDYELGWAPAGCVQACVCSLHGRQAAWRKADIL